MRFAAVLAVASLVKVAAYYVLSRTAGGQSQYCNLGSGSTCCRTEAAPPLDPVSLCFENNRITVNAGSYGSYTLNGYVETSSPQVTYGSTFDTSQTSKGVWPFHGYPEEVTGTYGNPGSLINFCHGPQCCLATIPDNDDASLFCTTERHGNMDPVTITLKRGGVSVSYPRVVLRLDTQGTPPNWYELAMAKDVSPRDVAGQLQTYFKATGGPFSQESVSATDFYQASLNGNKSVHV